MKVEYTGPSIFDEAGDFRGGVVPLPEGVSIDDARKTWPFLEVEDALGERMTSKENGQWREAPTPAPVRSTVRNAPPQEEEETNG